MASAWRKCEVLFDLETKQFQVEELSALSVQDNFWQDNQRASGILKQINNLNEEINGFKSLEEKSAYLEELIQMTESETEVDPEIAREILDEVNALVNEFKSYEMGRLFSGEHDGGNAIIALHAGAGGTEAQDWVSMLLRMYTRWAENSAYTVEMLDYLPGDEAGVKSVTLLIKGRFAYGKLKAEAGVHRLIRISPFDSSGRRHTSFASLSVLPEIEDTGEIDIDPNDLKIDTYRASGAGGQHINKTDSAVRITHLPTGLVAQCQNERSQHSNRLTAMKILLAKLYELKEAEQAENLQRIKGESKEIAWSSQIRTYTMNPFSLVKDHRTGVENGNVNAVMDGELDSFIYARLEQQVQGGD